MICNIVGIDPLDGFNVTDVLRIGEYSLRNFNFQTIVTMKSRPPFLDRFSGKLGLGPASDVTPGNFAQSLLTAFPDEPVFTFWFRPDHDGVFRGGIFSFGGIHDYRYDGPLIYLPMMLPTSWTVQATRPLLQASFAQWGLGRESTDRNVRGSKLTSSSQLPVSMLGQPGSILALVISLGRDITCHQGCTIQFNTAYPYFYGPPQQIHQIHQLLRVDRNLFRRGRIPARL
ncbi:hypothetical protein T265_11819 [Opisthorchis viverrini]|uniref:Peptidase A1 domain-containing protein n=1 Tax=Opisthorchis viverrini TaxID=6198 RepID=A0A074YX66_OPIVI|nr:hypothetical protein T265_11819 [Opisthorchis viverrini]KER19396.1 hypothetical protein T265_11819 [Opisthorchis viverrini]